MHAADGYTASNISATTAAFSLFGGMFTMICIAGSWSAGTVKLQMLAPDGSTWVDFANGSSFTANAVATFLALCPGSYRINVASATGVYAALISLPTQ